MDERPLIGRIDLLPRYNHFFVLPDAPRGMAPDPHAAGVIPFGIGHGGEGRVGVIGAVAVAHLEVIAKASGSLPLLQISI